MTTPSRDTVVLQEDDLLGRIRPHLEGSAEGSHVARNLGSRGTSSETIAQITGSPSALSYVMRTASAGPRFVRQKSLSAEFDLSRFLLVKLELP